MRTTIYQNIQAVLGLLLTILAIAWWLSPLSDTPEDIHARQAQTR